MNEIQNILFDLGNVLIDLDIPRTESMFKTLLKDEYDKVQAVLLRRNIFEQFETGQISEETFIWAFQQAARQNLDPRDVIRAWNGMLLGFPAHRFDFLEKLKKKYRLFVFSNTNETHLRWVYRHLKTQHGMTDFDVRFFEKTFYSHLIGHRKPEVAAFRHVLNAAGIAAEKTLFIDDNAENIAGATAAGLHTIHHKIGDEVTRVMQQFLD